MSLSSAEAEYVACVSAVCDSILVKAAFDHLLGRSCEHHLFTDSAACRGIFQRQGVGKLRHIQGRLLWLQHYVKNQHLKVHPVSTATSPADIGTKNLHPSRIEMLSGIIQIRDGSRNYALLSEDADAEQARRVEVRNQIRSVKKLGGHLQVKSSSSKL